jgi:excisionase family DNA binding protein
MLTAKQITELLALSYEAVVRAIRRGELRASLLRCRRYLIAEQICRSEPTLAS